MTVRAFQNCSTCEYIPHNYDTEIYVDCRVFLHQLLPYCSIQIHHINGTHKHSLRKTIPNVNPNVARNMRINVQFGLQLRYFGVFLVSIKWLLPFARRKVSSDLRNVHSASLD